MSLHFEDSHTELAYVEQDFTEMSGTTCRWKAEGRCDTLPPACGLLKRSPSTELNLGFSAAYVKVVTLKGSRLRQLKVLADTTYYQKDVTPRKQRLIRNLGRA